MGDTDSIKKKKSGFRLFRRSGKTKSSSSSVVKPAAASTSRSATKASSNSSTVVTKDPTTPKLHKPVLGLAEQAPPATPKKATTPSPASPKTTTTAAAPASPKKDDKKDDKAPKPSWLCRTSFFKNMCKTSFALIDADGSGEVDEKELYSGLLLIHLKLGTYAGPAACKPLSRERCHIVFHKFDKDKSGYLDKEEFDNVMMVLFGNVLFRVLLQYAMTLMIVPFLAQYILNGICGAIHFVSDIITNLDEHSTYAHEIELTIEGLRDVAFEMYNTHAPNFVTTGADTASELLASVPDSVWNTIPLTFTSAILGVMIVPWSILKMDDFFQHLAEKKAKEV